MSFKKRLVRLRDQILYRLLDILGPAFSDRKYAATTLATCALRQKVLRINHHVPWPVHWTSKVAAPHRIERGNRCPGLSIGCHIDGRNGIIIGKNVWIGPRVSLISMNHDMSNYTRYIETDPIVIGDNCWLGASSVILPGVKLGNHIVVAAGAVVTKSFLQNDIVLAGVPARIIKELPPYQTRPESE
jgi:acetyltransferase-like isoleucine patch superfamily enzyme